MSQTAKSQTAPALSVLEQREDDARQFLSVQARSQVWASLPGTRSIGFMDLRSCACRWPVNDPAFDGAVRYCGAVCAPEASYCDAHQGIAFAPAKRR